MIHNLFACPGSKKLVCTAFLADILNAPPTSMVYLTIVKKTTQKGE